MSADNQDLSQDNGQQHGRDSTFDRADVVDFNFLKSQTFSDETLEREVLDLYVTQSRQILSTISSQDSAGQAEMVHLAKGSAQGIGAWAVADAAARYEVAAPAQRSRMLPALRAAIEATLQAVTARLAQIAA